MQQINKAIDRDVTVNHHVLDQEKNDVFHCATNRICIHRWLDEASRNAFRTIDAVSEQPFPTFFLQYAC